MTYTLAGMSWALAVFILICFFFFFVYSTEHTEVKDLFIEAARLMKNGEIDADVQVFFVSTGWLFPCIILIIWYQND